MPATRAKLFVGTYAKDFPVALMAWGVEKMRKGEMKLTDMPILPGYSYTVMFDAKGRLVVHFADPVIWGPYKTNKILFFQNGYFTPDNGPKNL